VFSFLKKDIVKPFLNKPTIAETEPLVPLPTVPAEELFTEPFASIPECDVSVEVNKEEAPVKKTRVRRGAVAKKSSTKKGKSTKTKKSTKKPQKRTGGKKFRRVTRKKTRVVKRTKKVTPKPKAKKAKRSGKSRKGA
jgi:hypothetical protein